MKGKQRQCCDSLIFILRMARTCSRGEAVVNYSPHMSSLLGWVKELRWVPSPEPRKGRRSKVAKVRKILALNNLFFLQKSIFCVIYTCLHHLKKFLMHVTEICRCTTPQATNVRAKSRMAP